MLKDKKKNARRCEHFFIISFFHFKALLIGFTLCLDSLFHLFPEFIFFRFLSYQNFLYFCKN